MTPSVAYRPAVAAGPTSPACATGSISPTCAAYDAFADLYARHWAPVLWEHAVRAFDALLAPQISMASPPGRGHASAALRVLDLCCGTGEAAAALSARGHTVLGLDGSAGMIERARRAAPHTEFREADARAFNVSTPVDAVLCTFDSLNHLGSLDELRAAFRCVYAALRPGGGFLFDLNTRAGFEERFEGSFAFVEADRAVLVDAAFDREADVGRYALTVFRRAARVGTEEPEPGQGQATVAAMATAADEAYWTRTDAVLEQRCFEVDDVCALLAGVGFETIRLFDAETALDMEGHVGRTFFTALRGPG